MKKKKRVKILLSVLIPIIAIFGISSSVSFSYFGVINPIASGIGLIKVKMAGTAFVEVQKTPKVIFFKSDTGIVKTMEENGYAFLEEEQMGSMLVFEKDNIKYQGISNGGIISFWQAELYF